MSKRIEGNSDDATVYVIKKLEPVRIILLSLGTLTFKIDKIRLHNVVRRFVMQHLAKARILQILSTT